MLSARKRSSINTERTQPAVHPFRIPAGKELEWSDAGVEGSYRFLNRVHRLVFEVYEKVKDADSDWQAVTAEDKKLNYSLNAAIKKVTEDVGGRFNFNTAISSIMELVNELYRYKENENLNLGLLKTAIESLILILRRLLRIFARKCGSIPVIRVPSIWKSGRLTMKRRW
jgi:leucyl-tRNA synthetase